MSETEISLDEALAAEAAIERQLYHFKQAQQIRKKTELKASIIENEEQDDIIEGVAEEVQKNDEVVVDKTIEKPSNFLETKFFQNEIEAYLIKLDKGIESLKATATEFEAIVPAELNKPLEETIKAWKKEYYRLSGMRHNEQLDLKDINEATVRYLKLRVEDKIKNLFTLLED